MAVQRRVEEDACDARRTNIISVVPSFMKAFLGEVIWAVLEC
jgi:hypothetical protein